MLKNMAAKGGSSSSGGSSGGGGGGGDKDKNSGANVKSTGFAAVETSACRVLIIGAGIAGLAAANHLAKNGMRDLKILEARNRIGGRIISINLGPHRIELGAMWIHGVLGNPIYEIALANRLININIDRKMHNVMAFTEQGHRVPIHVLQEVYEVYYYFLKRCEEFYLCGTTPPIGLKSVGEHVESDIVAYLARCPPEDRRLRRMIFDHLLSRETCISGCNSMADINLAEFGSYTELPGGNLQIDKGFSSILEYLAAALPANCIHQEHTVRRIKWNCRRGPTTSSNHSSTTSRSYDCEVECENGRKYRADHVLVTVPLGVLKEKAGELFDPPLPQYKLDAIQRLSFGTVNKIFLEYDRPFLHPDISEIIVLWERPGCGPNAPPSVTWYRKIFSFTKVNDVLLLTWLSGTEATFAETLSAETIADTCTEILRKFLKDPYVPKPKRVVRTRWGSEVNTRGAYTAIAVGSSQEDIENLAKPIYVSPSDSKPALMFAGEATHPSFYSTTHGAFLTGRLAAQQLLEPDSPPKSSNEPANEELAELSSWIRGISLS